ncbi:winged helix-turn-helix domain-containing protein [Thiocystis violacea]|uniref:winged helix-turn-helix domain-containing protein n=1 Tax=Thiocystis violacea TaxID=13725 RepID=UPI0019065189
MQPGKTVQERWIGPWRLIPARNLLQREGQEIRLEPRHVELLLFLSDRPGAVLGTEEIIAGVWNGQVVGDQSLYQAIAKLRKALGDDAANATYIETVSKRGYRLMAEVEDVPPDPARTPARRDHAKAAPESSGPLPGAWMESRRWRAILAAALLAILVGGSWIWLDEPAPDPSVYRTLVVLPFASLSHEASDAYIAEGFAIELANALGRSNDLRVLGPVSSKLVSEARIELAEVGRRLAANAVVSGSVRRAAGQLRISATLTDAATGYQLWTHIFDREDADVFAIQSSIGEEIAEALHRTLAVGDASPSIEAEPESPRAYDLFLLGRYYRAARSPDSLGRALGYFRQAQDIDPGFAPARREMAATYLLLSFYGDLPLAEALKESEPLLADCLREHPDDAEVIGAIGLSHYLRGAHGLAEDYLTRAVGIQPNYAEGWMWLGLARQQQGRLPDATAAFAKARALEPLMATAVGNQAKAFAWAGDRTAAREMLLELAATVVDQPHLFRVLSDLALESGELVEAHAWATKALAIDPNDALSKANLAMVLGFLGQTEPAATLMLDAWSSSQPGRAVQRYIDRLGIAAPSLLPTDPDEAYISRMREEPDLPEIDWRLANARTGLARYVAGEHAIARDRLRQALDGRAYPIERTDYDLFLCATLADASRRAGEADESARWLDRCEGDLAEAKRQGWKTPPLEYAEARLLMLRQEPTAALERLDALVGRGFRNLKLLEIDPVFEELREDPAFRELRARIETLIRQAWAEIQATNH